MLAGGCTFDSRQLDDEGGNRIHNGLGAQPDEYQGGAGNYIDSGGGRTYVEPRELKH